MKDTKEKIIQISLIAGFIAVMALASSEDYNQAVIETIPPEAYEAIVNKLGPGCSNGEIVEEYQSNEEEYNTIVESWEK